MELISRDIVSIHLVDENFLIADEIREKYSWKDRYHVIYYPTVDKLVNDIAKTSFKFKGIHIVILAVFLAKPDKDLSNDIIGRIISAFPGINIIKICHEKELDRDVASIRGGNVIRIVNNENSMLRIDNAIKWVLAKINLENKKRWHRYALALFLVSFAASVVIYFLL